MTLGRPNPGGPARRLIVVLTHVLLWAAAYAGAYQLRFDGEVPAQILQIAANGIGPLLLLRALIFWRFGLFHGILRYAGVHEVRTIVQATTLASTLFILLGFVAPALRLPRSIYVGEWVLAISFASGLRLAVRVLRERTQGQVASSAPSALLIGAGDAGEMFLRDLERSPTMRVAAILDDDTRKHGAAVRGIRVVGAITATSIRRAVEDYGAKLAILAMPSASGARTREIVTAFRELGVDVKTLPGIQQILNGEVKVSMLRDVAIEDLLRRDPVQLDDASMASFLRGKRVVITGGAGSIGSELARQAACYAPSSLVILDHNENGLFFLERELRAVMPNVPITACVADIKDARRISDVLRTFRPHVILHAAAHKHVPLMEANPAEAIKNNVFGTKVVADLANAHGVDTFVLISTDKAVNPTSVMGASKRISEMYLQSLSNNARTRFVAVRFGNVLGSAGSVVPIFREQIAKGGPVTVTHPDMRRYFMTIPEAAQLVLQAGALARGGEIFVLDMGEPVKIVELARDMIRMSGLRPEVDIPIVFAGQRPGEKLFEELMHVSEGYDRTVHPKILVGRIPTVLADSMARAVDQLSRVIDSRPEDVRHAIANIVPEAMLEGLSARPKNDELRDVLAQLEPLKTLLPAPNSQSA